MQLPGRLTYDALLEDEYDIHYGDYGYDDGDDDDEDDEDDDLTVTLAWPGS